MPPPVPAPAPIAEPAPAPPPVTLEDARGMRAAGKAADYEQALRTLTADPDATTQKRARALLALLLVEQKRNDEAAPALEEAATAYPEVAPFLRLREMEVEDARGNAMNAVNVASRIIAMAPESSAATIARLRLPALFAALNDVPSTEAAYRQLVSLPLDSLTEEEFVHLATRLESANRLDLATSIRVRLLMDDTGGRYTEKTYGQLAQLPASPLDELPFEAGLALAQKLARYDAYDQALDLLARISKRFPHADTSEAYRAIRIRSQFNSRHYSDLLSETAKLKITDPALQLMRARAAWRVGQGPEFLAGLKQVEKLAPASKEASEAKVLRAKYYTTDERNYPLAIANLRAAIDAGAVGNEGENLWNLGWTYYLSGDADKALQTFDRYVTTFPDGDYKSNALFWSAKILDHDGKLDARNVKLRALILDYPYSYYSYRAREIMGDKSTPSSDVIGGAIFPNLDAQLATVSDPRIVAVRELVSIDLAHDASREMKILAAAYPDNLAIAFMQADVYVQGGEPFKANGILQKRFRQYVRHGGSNIPRRFWEILFPLNYWETIRANAEKRSVDPYLLASIIRQESGFEPREVSNAGAVGLMQIMPAEALTIAAEGGIDGITRESLFDPNDNIAVGAAEYAQKLARQHGNPYLAIAAYNAGEDAVSKWLASTPTEDMDFFVESIPYAETRLYVKSVTRNRNEYHRIYGAQ